MESLEKNIAVMQAELDGKEVEFVYKGDVDWNLKKQGTPFNWQHFDYRVKSEETKPEYVPFESAEEFLQEQKEHCCGWKIISKRSREEYNIFVNPTNFYLLDNGHSSTYYSAQELLEHFMFKDFIPCGKLKK